MFDIRFQEITQQLGRPLILGHRGSPTLARENTLESFRLALESGADGIELDVQRTADHVLVAHHDDILPAGEALGSMPYEQLLPLARQAECELPTLEDVFRLVAGRGLLNIELKDAGFESEAVRLAREILPCGSYAFSSFDLRAVINCRMLAPEAPAFLIVWGERDIEMDIRLLHETDASGIAFENRFLTDQAVRAFRAAGFPIFAWTVNDPAEARHFAGLGVTGLISDVPELLIKAFAS